MASKLLQKIKARIAARKKSKGTSSSKLFTKLKARIAARKKKDGRSYIRRMIELRKQYRAGKLTREQYEAEKGKLKIGFKKRSFKSRIAAAKIKRAERIKKLKAKIALRRALRRKSKLRQRILNRRLTRLEKKTDRQTKTIKNKLRIF